ncbi:MAG: LPS export ABC transporter permease LptF, partial [Ketobacter sp.]
MIIYRYLSRQLFWATIAVSSILTFILVSSRFLKYLSQAAVGKLEGGAVFMIMAYRLPDFLELILPLGLFLGILLSYGRMYLENEMVVLQACGVSQRRLVALSLIPAICMSLLIGYFAFFLSPWGAQKANNLIFEQQTRSGLDVLSPRRFHSTRDGSTVTYVEDIDSRAGVMKNLFIVNYDRENVGDEYSKVILMRATEGTYRIDDKGNRYLVMSNGVRFEVDPGSSVFAQTRYGEYTIKLEEKLVSQGAAEFQDRTTEDLLGDDSISARVE